jgi:chromosome partitioning protein
VSAILTVANQKGGVGKTTTAVNLGACLAGRGWRVLLIDADPQANATTGLGLTARAGRSLYDVLVDDTELAGAVVETGQANLSIVPATDDLAGAEVELVAFEDREYRLRKAVAGERSDYDLILIDAPPSLGLLTVNALAAAESVIVPVQCEYLALEGLGRLMHTIELVRQNLNHSLRLQGVLLTMYDGRTNLCQQVAAEVRSHFANTFETVIPRSVRLSEAPSYGLPILAYDRSSRAGKAYEALADEVLAALGKVSA